MKRVLYYALLAVSSILVLGFGSAHAQSGLPSVEADVAYTGEAVGVVSGGVDRGVVYLDNVDVMATAQSDSLVGWSGLTAFVYGLGNQGGTLSTRVGDAQVTSNIEAPLSWRLYEAWLQQALGTRASLLVGLYDLNAEFDVNRTGSLFLNSSHGIGAAFGGSGRNGPSIFPVTSLAGRVRVRLPRMTYAQAAVLDGVPGEPSDPGGTSVRFGPNDGVLVAGEIGTYLGASAASPEALVDRTAAVEARGKIAVGGWIYSTPLPEWPTVNTPGGVERKGGAGGCTCWRKGASSGSRAPTGRASRRSGASDGPATVSTGSLATPERGSSTPACSRDATTTASGWPWLRRTMERRTFELSGAAAHPSRRPRSIWRGRMRSPFGRGSPSWGTFSTSSTRIRTPPA